MSFEPTVTDASQPRRLLKVLRGIGAIIVVLMSAALWLWSFGGFCQPIDRIPFTIDKPGCFQLSRDFDFADPTGYAITIKADDVSLYFSGHRIQHWQARKPRALESILRAKKGYSSRTER